MNTTINLELKSLDANNQEISRKVQVMFQEVSPFLSMPVLTNNTVYDKKNKASYDLAGIVEDMVSNEVGVIVSPKNIVKQIAESTNAFDAIVILGSEVVNFCKSPKIYVLKKQEEVQAEGQESTDAVGENNTQPNTNASETVKQ